MVSAVTGEGTDALLALVESRINAGREVVELTVDLADGAALAWLYRNGDVLSRKDCGAAAHLKVGLDPEDVGRFRKLAARKPAEQGT